MGDAEGGERPHVFTIGCLTTMAGFFSGGMIAVLVAKGVDIVRKCTPAEGLPACDWHIFMLSGAVIGALTLPSVVLLRLRRSGTRDHQEEE